MPMKQLAGQRSLPFSDDGIETDSFATINLFLMPIDQVKKKKCDDNNNTTPPNNNNNNETNGHSGINAVTLIHHRRNGHGKCPAGAAANELKKA